MGRALGNSLGQQAPQQPHSSHAVLQGYMEVLRDPVGTGNPAAKLVPITLQLQKHKPQTALHREIPIPRAGSNGFCSFLFLGHESKEESSWGGEHSSALASPAPAGEKP